MSDCMTYGFQLLSRLAPLTWGLIMSWSDSLIYTQNKNGNTQAQMLEVFYLEEKQTAELLLKLTQMFDERLTMGQEC